MSHHPRGCGATLLLVSGPAGSGKTTLCEQLLKSCSGIERVITATTRAPRAGEVDGVDYYFLSEAEFSRGIAEGAFYEHAQVHGRHYGVLKAEIHRRLDAGHDLLLNIDVQGARSFRQAAQEDARLGERLVTVFIRPVSIEQIRERLFSRGTDDAREIERRLRVAQDELREAEHFDHIITSGTREDDFAAIVSILQACQARRPEA